jgi:hypothetical protein
MLIWIALVAFVIVLIYFLTQTQRRQQDEIWRSFRKRYRERRPHSPEQPIDPDFQFDRPPVDEKDKPHDPNQSFAPPREES